MKIIPYGRQRLDEEDIARVVDVLESDWITQGPKITEFEEALAHYCGAKYAVAVSSGTAALHLACLAADLKRGNEAITTPITFPATANAILYAGARPVFADIDYETGNISPEEIKKRLSKKTKSILPVHLAGLPSDLMEISLIAREKGLVVIEDGSHALGAQYRREKIGSCQYSDMTVFSFHPVKHITTGEGGAITTNSEKLYRKLKALSNHGIYRSEALRRKIGGWAYEMRALGFNYRITDFQCALGLSQLRKIDEFLSRRAEIALRYHQAFSELLAQVKLPNDLARDRTHAWHLYLFRLRRARISRRKLFETLRSQGINVQVHYIPVYRQPFYRHFVSNGKVTCPNAEKYYGEVLSLPIFPGLTDAGVNQVIRAVKGCLQ